MGVVDQLFSWSTPFFFASLRLLHQSNVVCDANRLLRRLRRTCGATCYANWLRRLGPAEPGALCATTVYFPRKGTSVGPFPVKLGPPQAQTTLFAAWFALVRLCCCKEGTARRRTCSAAPRLRRLRPSDEFNNGGLLPDLRSPFARSAFQLAGPRRRSQFA